MANKRGRVVGSLIRDNVVELLYFMEKSHAYEIAKTYKKVFGPISIRSVYYNLKKGQELGIFEVKEIQKVEGNFSWGSTAQRICYGLTDKAEPKINLKLKDIITKARSN
jgi:DNA-binding PadR family transcriptional regulator